MAARVTGADYEVRVRAATERPTPSMLTPILAQAAAVFAETARLPTIETREGRVRSVDVKSYVDRVEVTAGPGTAHTVSFRAQVTPAGTARPERVVDALRELAGVELEIEGIRRVQVLLS